MALRATKKSATTVELDLNDYAGKTVNLTINWSSDANETSSVTYNIGTDDKSINSSSDSFTTNAAGGRTYTFTHSSTLNDPDQDIRINTASGTTVSWGFEDGGGSGSTGVGGGNTDNDYNDGEISVTINSVDAGSDSVTITEDKPDVTPWSDLVPTCGIAPALDSSSGGLQISKSGDSSVVLNLKNYANKLVTLKVVHQGGGDWKNGFSFNIPQASDILVNGSSLDSSEFSNSDTSGTTTFYLQNLPGGDYNYTFSHSSVPGPRPTRKNYKETCQTTTGPVTTTDEDGIPTTTTVTTTTCVWEEDLELEEYPGAWPPCYVGVGLAKNGGHEVKWLYEDGGGGFGDQIVTITVVSLDAGSKSVTIPAGNKPAPTAWDPPLPTCGTAPTLSSSSGGLQISKSGDSSVVLNLKNYANKLVTLKVVHQEDAGWQNGFSFNIPQASDILAGGSPLGGSVYNRDSFSNSNTSGTTIFYLCNLDGGDYNYTFSHSSVPGPRPTRTDYNEVCTTTTENVTTTDEDGIPTTTRVTTTTCVWEAFTEEYPDPWPPCYVGVSLAKNGGDEVRWFYEAGAGDFSDQIVTITVVEVREAIPQSGGICMTDIKNQVWIANPADAGADGNCLSEYNDHSTKSRFRIPSIRASKTTLPDPLCFTDLRGVAGAKTPSELGL